MSATAYQTIEVVRDQPDLPTWSTYWAPASGCSGRTVYYNTPTSFTGPPTTAYDVYVPIEVRTFRSQSFNGRRRGYPPYRYTPWCVSKTTIQRHLVRRSYGTNGLDVYYQYGLVSRIGVSCVPTPTSAPHTGPLFSEWKTVAHDWPTAQTYVIHEFDSGDISDAIAEVEDDVARDSLTSYDALTDVAELKDVPRLITSVSRDLLSILRGLRGRHGRDALRLAYSLSPQQLLRHPERLLRKLGDEWMAYRYGIMPLVYSYRDIQKQVNRHTNVKDRAMRTVNPSSTGASLPGPTYTYKRISIDGTVTIRGNVFQSFTSDEVARASGLGMNPLVTAWELIPYSFVIDWFVNVGDYIARKACASYAKTRWACLSRHDSYTKKTEVHLPNQDQTITISKKTPTNWWGSLPPNPSPVILSNPEGYYLLQEETVDKYWRWLFDVRDAQIRFNPSLNWRRLIDGSVLSLNQLRSFLRSLR